VWFDLCAVEVIDVVLLEAFSLRMFSHLSLLWLAAAAAAAAAETELRCCCRFDDKQKRFERQQRCGK
jgi:hypothetical protein